MTVRSTAAATGPAGPRPLAVDVADDLPDALLAAGLRPGRAVLVVVGGAGGMPEPDLAALQRLAAEHLWPLLASVPSAVVDGGTDHGAMAALGRAHREVSCTVPLVGVAARGTVRMSGRGDDDRAVVEPNHSHVVLVPGDRWGDESPWLSQVASALAAGAPSLTLVVNGGEITYQDVEHSLAAGRPVVVLAGTGRTADAIAVGVDDRSRRLAGSDLVTVVPAERPEQVARTVARALGIDLRSARQR